MKKVWLDDDRFHDECGVFGIFGHPEAAHLTYLGLHALQHRGQESAGIVSSDGNRLFAERGMGHVGKVFTKTHLERLVGSMAIGHVRYSTAGESKLLNAQPFRIESHRGEMAIGHNGNLVNASQVRGELERTGSIFQTTSDTEVILHLIARSQKQDLEEAIVDALGRVEGAYSLVFLFPGKLIAVRDPRGFRPLSLGRLGGATLVTSETCALDLIDAEFVRDVKPGEMVVITEDGTASYHPFPAAVHAPCIFEYVYFARPDSLLYGRSVNLVRKRLGRELAKEQPAQADLVVPVPDSGVAAGVGFSEESGIPFEFGLVRNHYVGRTFIEPRQSIRHFGVKLKLNPVRHIIAGKRVVLVDDSIVRGTTSRKIVSMVRAAGAKEIHVRISCPPTTGPCYYGIDTPRRSELIASSHSVEEICKYIQADSLGYLSRDGMYRAVGDLKADFCDACYTGNYPVPVPRDSRAAARNGVRTR
ncbi:MAG TPA: amidophosphoribosyltransferase [Candidatus Polarisedimenticolia bacterium]|nr:amidophosphoribosyltransferase [Candidatus Polarisedimenticolia bacterium]